MGNDGGSIPKRRELVKNAARAPTVSELKATALESLSHAWTYDYLASISSDNSTSSLMDLENAVSDWRGRLYNYETILRGLTAEATDDAPGEDAPAVNGNGEPITFASTGVKSLRDIVKLQFKRYTAPGSKDKETYACPISLKEIGPGTKSVYLVPCGHVFAEVAIKEAQDERCPECSEAYLSRDVITILPTEVPDVTRLEKRMEELRAQGLTHSLKKGKSASKKKKRQLADDDEPRLAKKASKVSDTVKAKADVRVSGINNEMTATITAKVLAAQDDRSKRRKMAAAG